VQADDAPLVSVVVPFLDAERFLPEAIDSVFAQTYARWELLLVDDGSTDGSTAIARQYAARHPDRIRYLEHEGHLNQGVSASRNLGLAAANGELVALLDADDVWLPRKLEEQVGILAPRPKVAMVYGRSEYWRSWTGAAADIDADFVPDPGVETDTVIHPPRLLLLSYPLGMAPTPCPSDLLLRRAALERVGGWEDAFRGLYEDQALLAKLYMEERVYVSATCWDRYRLHPDSCEAVAKRRGEYLPVRRFYFDWLARHIASRGIDVPEVTRALRRARWRDRHPGLHRLIRRVRWAGQGIQGLLCRSPWLQPASAPPVGCVRFGSLRSVRPISRQWGFDRGQPIDRHYIEDFLARNAIDIRGRVLEVGWDRYTRRFGGTRVVQSDILHAREGNPEANIVADLARADHLPSATYDCIILTQVLQFVYDLRAAIATVHRVLKPGGVVLVTVPGITRVESDQWSGEWCWSFTPHSVRRLFETFEGLAVDAHGNVLAAVAFLHGLTIEELRREQLDHQDPEYPVVIAVRARKPLSQ